MSLREAIHEASQLLDEYPELVVEQHYSTVLTTCDRCQTYGAFRPSDPQLIVRILGYC